MARLMFPSVASIRTALAALGVLASVLLAAPTAEASPAKAHQQQHHRCGCRRIVSPKQAFKRIATRRPDRMVRRHVTSLIRSAHVTHRGTTEEVAIPTTATVTVEADTHASPALERVGVLSPEHSPLHTHEGLGPTSPRGPPVLS
jgi:hypothetical protein